MAESAPRSRPERGSRACSFRSLIDPLRRLIYARTAGPRWVISALSSSGPSLIPPLPLDGRRRMKQSTNLASKLRLAIEEGILSGEYPLGAPLEDQVLAKRFGTSRTPVREALLQLAADGLVEIKPRSGTYVAKPTVKEVLGVIECLAIFESSAARLAARRMTAEERREFSSMYEANAAAAQDRSSVPSRSDYEKLNGAFHEAIYAGCGNVVLAQQIRTMRLRVATWGRSFFESNNRIRDSMLEHKEIAQAIVDGDETAAADRMAAHITAGGQPIADLLLRLTD